MIGWVRCKLRIHKWFYYTKSDNWYEKYHRYCKSCEKIQAQYAQMGYVEWIDIESDYYPYLEITGVEL